MGSPLKHDKYLAARNNSKNFQYGLLKFGEYQTNGAFLYVSGHNPNDLSNTSSLDSRAILGTIHAMNGPLKS